MTYSLQVVDCTDIEELAKGKTVYCRCWQSKKVHAIFQINFNLLFTTSQKFIIYLNLFS